MLRTTLIALLGTLLTPSLALAWDFTCSPRSVTEIEPTNPPNMMLMLDQSGSMGDDKDYGTRIPLSCKVCELPDGTKKKVDNAGECATGGAWTQTKDSIYPRDPSVSGYSHFFTFNPVAAVSGQLELTVSIEGDFNDKRRFYDVFVDGDFRHRETLYVDCGSRRNVTIKLPASYASDGVVNVELRTAADWGGDDGVDAHCADNSATVTLANKTSTYLGTITSLQACGYETKWDQAVNAIDLMTTESSALDPDLAAFGLGLFEGSAAKIYNECEQDSHVPIMKSLADSGGPKGSTPTALAIRTSLNSACVKGAISGVITVTDTQTQNKNSGLENFEYVHNLSVTPQTSDVSVDITLRGDYNNSCEYADIFAYDASKRAYNSSTPPPASMKIGTHNGNSDKCKASTKSFIIPKEATANGKLRIEVWNSSKSYAGKAGCFGSDGVQASCDTNSSFVSLKLKSGVTRAAATVLITDGAPTVDYDGEKPYLASVLAACDHRKLANLYVVGQGAGTDLDFNNILAAAGGSGSCAGNVDPCTNPSDYDSLRGLCTGAYQTDNSADLLAAIAAITNEIQCVFDVDFAGAPVGDVPLDTTNEYPYLYIQGRFA